MSFWSRVKSVFSKPAAPAPVPPVYVPLVPAYQPPPVAVAPAPVAPPVAAPAAPVRDPAYLYPGDVGYPLGGPAAALGLPVLKTAPPNLGNPNFTGAPPPADPAKLSLLKLIKDPSQPQSIRQWATTELIAALGFPGSNADSGTAANVALAQFINTYSTDV